MTNIHTSNAYLASIYDACGSEYRKEPSTMPKWYRSVTSDYTKNAMPSGVVTSLGFELKPENRMYTTCVKTEIRKTEWRR